jgi:hypothetical protein
VDTSIHEDRGQGTWGRNKSINQRLWFDSVHPFQPVSNHTSDLVYGNAIQVFHAEAHATVQIASTAD